MKDMIATRMEKLNREIELVFEKDEISLEAAEEYFVSRISCTVRDLLAMCYESKDAELLADKKRRREAGLTVERRGDKRQIMTQMGVVNYHRTYYSCRDGGYCYPIDCVVGLEPYQRISSCVSLSMVEAAREMSYSKASQAATGGLVSKQTVMQKIRECVPAAEPVARRAVPVLHVDADEDHVHMQTGDSRIAPIVSVYEGTERIGKRGKCKNIFHIASFGKGTDELWENVLSEMERRYDLTNTKVYLHGDGAPWIKSGLEWIPDSTLVLDRYHVNKALKECVSGLDRRSGSQYEHHLRQALAMGDADYLRSVRDSLLAHWPEREKTILKGTGYLLENLEAIHIYNVDPEASRGGATEPHVSHVLSSRLSSRPMGWSAQTLEHLVPILAAGGCRLQHVTATAEQDKDGNKATLRKKARPKMTLGLPHPDLAVDLPGKSGKITPLYRLLASQLY